MITSGRALLHDGTYVRIQPTNGEQLAEAQVVTLHSRGKPQSKPTAREVVEKTA